MRLKVLCVLCMVVLVLVPLTGCQAAAEKAAEKTTGVDVNQDEGKVTITGKEGEKVEVQSGDDVSLPDGFPEDVPIYKDATLTASNSYTAEGKTTYSVIYETSDDVKTVHAWYKEALPKDGWTIESDVTSTASGGAMALIGAKKGERSLNVSVGSNEDESKTAITIIVPE